MVLASFPVIASETLKGTLGAAKGIGSLKPFLREGLKDWAHRSLEGSSFLSFASGLWGLRRETHPTEISMASV